MNEQWRRCRFRFEDSNCCVAVNLTDLIIDQKTSLLKQEEVYSCEKIRAGDLCPIAVGLEGLKALSRERLQELTDNFKLEI